MTCREKLKIEHPDKLNPLADGGCMGCPEGYGYLPKPEFCKHIGDPERCTRCWDREIPENGEIKEEIKMKEERKFYSCTEISQMSDFEKNSLIVRLQSDIASKNVDCIDLKNRLNDEIIKLENKNALLALDISRLEKSRCCDERVKTLEEEINKLKIENKNLAESNYVLNDHIDEYEFVIKEADKKKTNLETLTSGLEKQVSNLEITIEGLEEGLTKRNEMIRELEHTVYIKNKDINEKNEFIKHLNEKNDHLIERLDDQRKKIEALENGDVLPYFIRKVVGDKLKEDPCCWATPAEKHNCIEDPICKSVPCSETIKRLEKKVDDIPCIKAKIKPVDKFIASCWNDGTGIKAKEAYDYIIEDMKRIQELCNAHSYNKIAERIMRKYQALRHAGFDHDTALSFIPMWSDE